MAQEKKITAEAEAPSSLAAPTDLPEAAGEKVTAPSFIPMTPSLTLPITPPPLPPAETSAATEPAAETEKPPKETSRKKAAPSLRVPETRTATSDGNEKPARRIAKRRPAGPVRSQLAANDDAPSIGGLIYALEQKPSNAPFRYAALASVVWTLVAGFFGSAIVSAELEQGATILAFLSRPMTFITLASVLVPIAIIWFLALLAWRSEELRLRSSTMTEVAVRLAEPDRMAEQSVASLGQAVRRQVAFMNDAVARALGRAGELEALVHNEVTALERSYEENERKIRGLIQELVGERHAITNTSSEVTETLKRLGTDVPALIDKLTQQQIKLAQIIQGAGDNLTALESAVGQSAQRLEHSLGSRTDELQTVLDNYSNQLGTALGTRTEQMQEMLTVYTAGLATALGHRTEQMQGMLENYSEAISSNIGSRTENLQAVFEEYARALDSTIATRAQHFDEQLLERTRSLDEAFAARLRHFDETIQRSTAAIDSAVSDKQLALTSALENHAKSFSETVARQSLELDEALIQGINSVRRTSENITRQSLKAIEGLAGQSELLKNVSENLLTQINTITNRFENQGQTIMRAANSLEGVNYRIDQTLQARHAELSQTLAAMSGKAEEFSRFVEGYSSTIAGSLTDAEARARAAAREMLIGAERTKQAALADLSQIRAHTDAESQRALEELRHRFSAVSSTVSRELDTLATRFDETSEEMRQRARKAANDIAAQQAWLREQMDHLPQATRESTDAMRRALQDQVKALEQLSSLAQRHSDQRDVVPPVSQRGAMQSLPEVRSTIPDRPLPPSHTPHYPQPTAVRDPAQRKQPPALPRPAASQHQPTADANAWSLGDLLARASREEEVHQSGADVQQPYRLNVDVIARSLDDATTSAIWQRLRSGQRGVMVRSIYNQEGRIAFDEITRRIGTDASLQRTVNRYLADFERIRAEAEIKDPTGRLVQNHLMSDTGRVYLFLAHASGRLA
jgi:ABC-type transporter Mla subunit MlaD